MEQVYTQATFVKDGVGTVSGDAGATLVTGTGTDWPHDMGTDMAIALDLNDDGTYETVYTISAIPSRGILIVEETISSSFVDEPYQVWQVAYQASAGIVSGVGALSERCDVCGRVRTEDQLVREGGKAYCVPNGCDKELEEAKNRDRHGQGRGFRIKV